jgi:hypothetical protein
VTKDCLDGAYLSRNHDVSLFDVYQPQVGAINKIEETYDKKVMRERIFACLQD